MRRFRQFLLVFFVFVLTVQLLGPSLVYASETAIDNPTEGVDAGQRKDITNITENAYVSFQLNSAGRSWINYDFPFL